MMVVSLSVQPPYEHAQSRDVSCFVTQGSKYTTTVFHSHKICKHVILLPRLFVLVITLFF